VHRDLAAAHAAQRHRHGHIAERPLRFDAGNTKSRSRIACISSRMASAGAERGARCSLPAFIRSARARARPPWGRHPRKR
jgi:hypothetical protein